MSDTRRFEGRGRGPRRNGGGFRPRPSYGGPPVRSDTDYRGLVEFVARAVAEEPDAVEVTAFDRPRGGLAIKIKMAEADVGKLIGKGGRNIEALRSLVRTAALREHRRVFVDLA